MPAWRPSSTGSAASFSSSPEAGARRVGRDGFLHLDFERRAARTVLVGRRFTLPLQALEPVDLDGSGGATLMLLNPTGGLLGGDVLDTRVSLGPGARVCLTTPSAARAYRCPGPPAVQRFLAEVGEGAALEYLPEHLIPSPGARLRQSVEIVLASGATALILDAWAVGRAARGEAWRFDEVDTALVIRDPRGLVLSERSILGPARSWDGLGGAEGAAYVATFTAAAPGREEWGDLGAELAAALEEGGTDLRWGVTRLVRGGLLVRLLCPSAPSLYRCMHTLWARCRHRLLGLPPLALRKL
ncbi:MAG TPA: urease accessory protein UreD [Methylomirabilota bacterium]|nr:urease accessory protein UreD [Methylomirabilota bacterium]